MLHFNMPFSLSVIVGRCFVDPYRPDQTRDVWFGSEIDPVLLGHGRLPNGQIIEHWLIVQNNIPILVTDWIGMPDGLDDDAFYDVGYLS